MHAMAALEKKKKKRRGDRPHVSGLRGLALSLSKCRVGFALVGGVVTGSWVVFLVYVFVHLQL